MLRGFGSRRSYALKTPLRLGSLISRLAPSNETKETNETGETLFLCGGPKARSIQPRGAGSAARPRGRNQTGLVGPGLAPAKADASVGPTSFAKCLPKKKKLRPCNAEERKRRVSLRYLLGALINSVLIALTIKECLYCIKRSFARYFHKIVMAESTVRSGELELPR
jgi:hypothetical protein